MDKTVVVVVEDRVKHPKYGKVIRRTKKYKAHDGANACGIGDRVLLMETRPLSATKRWRVAEILEKGQKACAGERAASARAPDPARMRATDSSSNRHTPSPGARRPKP